MVVNHFGYWNNKTTVKGKYFHNAIKNLKFVFALDVLTLVWASGGGELANVQPCALQV